MQADFSTASPRPRPDGLSPDAPPGVEAVRIYCELIPPERLLGEDMLRFFEGFRSALRCPVEGRVWSGRVELVLKVVLPPGAERLPPGVAEVLRAEGRGQLGVDRLWLWGQLADQDRVYLNIRTWPAVVLGWERLLREVERCGGAVEGAFFDLEPDRVTLDRLMHAPLRGAASLAWQARLRGWRRETAKLGASVRALEGRIGAPMLAACAPLTALGGASSLAEQAVGTPLWCDEAGAIWPELTCMNYVSFLLPRLGGVDSARAWGWSARLGGVLARRHVAWTRARGLAGSVICGTNCIGILGDEPSYPDAAAMAPLLLEVARARPRALEVFNLTGIVYGPQGYDAGFEVRPWRWRAWAEALREALWEGSGRGISASG